MFVLIIIEKELNAHYQTTLKWDVVIEHLSTILNTNTGVERFGENVLLIALDESLHLFSEVCMFLDTADLKPKYRCLFFQETPVWVKSKKIYG